MATCSDCHLCEQSSPLCPLNLLRTSAVNVCSERCRVKQEHIYGQNHKTNKRRIQENVNVRTKYKDNFLPITYTQDEGAQFH